MARRLVAKALIEGIDQDLFWEEFGQASFWQITIFSQPEPQKILEMECRWGGECRVELQLTGRLQPDESVQISGEAKLFEGSSEDTTDLDGQIQFTEIVAPDETISSHRTVRNTEEGRADRAHITLKLSNVAHER